MLVTCAVAAEWHTEVIAAGYPHDIALDSNDNPHTVYVVNTEIFYAHRDNGKWTCQHIAEADSYSRVSFDLNSNDCPHVCYIYNGNAYYIYYDGQEWNNELVLTDCTYASVKVGSNNMPHIICNSDGIIIYIHYDGMHWYTETVHDGGIFTNGFVLDSLNRPHIIYTYYEPYDYRVFCYAYRDVTGWSNTGFFALPTSFSAALTVDDNYNKHIAYGTQLCLWYQQDYPLQDEIIYTIGLDPYSIAIDEYNGVIYVSSCVDGDMYVSCKLASSWITHLIGDDSECIGLRCDSTGKVHIIYQYNVILYSYLDNNCPGVFSLLYPLDGNIYDDYPLADWEDAIDPDAGDDVTYELWYSQDEDFVNYEAVTDLAESEYQFTSDELDMNAT